MWDKDYLLSNNNTKVRQQKCVIVQQITYKYKVIKLIERTNANFKKVQHLQQISN